MKVVDVREAEKHLSRMLDQVAAGEEFVLGKRGEPIARLVAVDPPSEKRPSASGGGECVESGAEEKRADQAPVSKSEEPFNDPPLRKLTIKWFDVEAALAQSPDSEVRAYLNIRTGEIVLVFPDMEDCEELLNRIEEEKDWIEVEPIDSHTGYRMMERFASAVENPRVRDDLFEALSGRRPFRRFKDVLLVHETFREDWFAFEAAAQKEEMEKRLAGHGIQPEWRADP